MNLRNTQLTIILLIISELNKLTENPNKEVKFKEEGDNVQNKGSGNIFLIVKSFKKQQRTNLTN